MNNDQEQLKLLSIFHYIIAGFIGLFACFPIFHLVTGIVMLVGGFGSGPDAPPPILGLIFILFAVFFIGLGWTMAAAIAVAGRFLSTQRNRMYCLVVAGISTIFAPFGTVLGVFTIVVLMRPSVRDMFLANQPPSEIEANVADDETDSD